MILKNVKKICWSGLATIVLFSCTKKSDCVEIKIKQPYSINTADTHTSQQKIYINDSSKSVYQFHPNRRLQCYFTEVNKKYHGSYVFFYENGNIESCGMEINNKRSGSTYDFYPSGNIQLVTFYLEDGTSWMNVSYYDKFLIKKYEMLESINGDGYVYRIEYDSATQNVIFEHDHRDKELELYPNMTVNI
jgi:antitoxin component YwqK of YwqJK toxin-antitoxin module